MIGRVGAGVATRLRRLAGTEAKVDPVLRERALTLWERMTEEERYYVRLGIYPPTVAAEAVLSRTSVDKLASALTRIAKERP